MQPTDDPKTPRPQGPDMAPPLQELQGPLLRILDGRTDLLNLREVELQLDVRDVKEGWEGLERGEVGGWVGRRQLARCGFLLRGFAA